MENNQNKKPPVILIVAIVIFSLFNIFFGIAEEFLNEPIISFISELVLGAFVIFAIAYYNAQKKKEKIEEKPSDVFEDNLNKEIFQTSEKIEQQTHNAEHVINNEKCKNTIEKPSKNCSFCGAKNPASYKHCDCCGKKL